MRDNASLQPRLAALPRLLTLPQAAEELGINIWALRRAIWNGELSQVRIGRAVRIERNDLENWLARQKVRGTAV